MGTYVGWMASIAVMLLAFGLAALGAVLVMAHRILEGIDVILASIHIPDEEEDDQPQQFVGPSDIPMSRSLMDVIGSQGQEDKDVGTFRGRPPWEAPPEEPDSKK